MRVTAAQNADHNARSVPGGTIIELASGQMATSIIPHLFRGSGDELQLDMNNKETDLTHEAVSIASFLGGISEMTCVSSSESCEWQDIEEKTCDQWWSPSDIIDWSNMVIDENEETLSKAPPLIPTSFEKGIIGGMSTNDFLMTKGLIDTGSYRQYLHLELFSQQRSLIMTK